MFARTSTWTGSDSTLEDWARHAVEKVAPMVKELPGNAGAVFLIDPQARRGVTLTFWDSEAAALASDQVADRSRESTIAATGVHLLEIGRYEVIARI